MKKITAFILFLLMTFLSINAQEKIDSLRQKVNPILFVNLNLSYLEGTASKISTGLSINYQFKKNLFSFRFIQNHQIETARDFLFGLFPKDLVTNTLSEYSLLYGKRFIKDDFSYHISAGISYNDYTRDDNGDITTKISTGFPLQIGVNWFMAKKEQYKIFDLIPVGKPTRFGRSAGINLYANIAKKSYVGLGFSFGLGWHKKYN